METVAKLLSIFQGWNLYIREYGNGTIFAVCIVLTIVLGQFLFRTYRFAGTLAAFRRADGSTIACILWWLLMLEGLRALCAYIPLEAVNAGVTLSDMTRNAVSLGFAASVIMLVIVLLRALILFQLRERIPATLLFFAAVLGATLGWREIVQLFVN